MGMPMVMECDEVDCAYNHEHACCAMGITIGDDDDPKCDTFVRADVKCMSIEVGGVGACKVAGCTHNECLLCGAEGVEIEHTGQAARCATYSAR